MGDIQKKTYVDVFLLNTLNRSLSTYYCYY